MHWPTFYISILHVVMMVEGFTPLPYPLRQCTRAGNCRYFTVDEETMSFHSVYTCINFPVLVGHSYMCFVFAHA